MKEILFLAHRLPYPPDRGDRIRSWNILKHLGRRARIHLGCFADDAAEAARLEDLKRAMGGAIGDTHVEVRRRNRIIAAGEALLTNKPISLTLFDSWALRRFVERILVEKPIDAIFVFSGQMAQFVPANCGKRFIMDFADVDSAKFEAYASQGPALLKALFRREARKLLNFERQVAARADMSLFVSEAEAALFCVRAGVGESRVCAIRNGVDLEFYDPANVVPVEAPRPLLVFTGQMDYRPNVEAVTTFAETVFPELRRSFPTLHLAIVGRNPAPAVLQLIKRKGVIVTGAVPDVRPWIAAADLIVAPLLIARGIQNKILEAMAMAKPVIASPAAFEGIDAVPGRDLIVSNIFEQTQTITNILSDQIRAVEIGTAARQQMERAYRWEAALSALDEILDRQESRIAA